MTKRKVFRMLEAFLLFFVMLFALMWATHSTSAFIKENPRIINGSIDLSQVDFSKGEKVYLNGELRFFENSLVMTQNKQYDANEAQKLTIPGYWDMYSPNLNGKSGGYGSYICNLTGVAPGQKLVLFFPNHWSAYKAYIDGQLIGARGNITDDTQKLIYHGETLLFAKTISDKPTHELVIEYAVDSVSGLDTSPIIMEYSYAQNFLNYTGYVSVVMSTVMVISLGILIVYYILIGSRRYQWAMPILVLSICVRYAVFNSVYVIRWLWEIHPFLNAIVIMALTFLAKLACAVFYREELKLDISNKMIKFFSIFYLALLVLFVTVPLGFYESYLDGAITILIYTINFYIMWKLCIYLYEDRPYGVLHSVTYAFLTVCFAMENYFYNGALRSDINMYAPLCVLTLIFVFVFVTAKKMTDFYEMELSMLKMQEDLNHSQISIMLSQIRPHFLYNALTAIQCLCRTDPAKAEKALIQFSRYLRANLSAINSQEYIPFTEELNHIENYLAIEKLRFGDRLEIIYEIEEADFVVPVLSIQPIVENAVKHGVSKKLDEGYVIIASRKVNNGYEITVTDNGVGFDTTKNIDEKSYGMRNITSRIKAMNNSTIKFNSKIGEGTEVVVTINT